MGLKIDDHKHIVFSDVAEVELQQKPKQNFNEYNCLHCQICCINMLSTQRECVQKQEGNTDLLT